MPSAVIMAAANENRPFPVSRHTRPALSLPRLGRGAPAEAVHAARLDGSASFQFLVDALRGEWQVIAPDWRGYGLSAWGPSDCYWFPDYMGDLDRLLAHFAPETAVALFGHSMGGNIASMYAGVRPDRVARLV